MKKNAVGWISVLSLLFSLSQGVLPASASSLTELTSTISDPSFSSCLTINCNINAGEFPNTTNVSYAWQFSEPIDFTGSACQHRVLGDIGCLKMTIKTFDLNQVHPDRFETWAPPFFWPQSTSTDIIWNGPANSYIYSAVTSDVTSDNYSAFENLTIVIGCSADCVFATGTTYSVDLVNTPMATPYNATPTGYESFPETVQFEAVVPEDSPVQQAGQTVNNYGPNLNITASVDARVGFNFQGKDAVDDSFVNENPAQFVDSTDSSCDFGTITPLEPKICLWDLNISTNAANGYSIYVVQDQNMTFNGNTIKQFNNGTRVDDAAATTWSSPSLNAQAHLGYSSNDVSVFLPDNDNAVWAGVPTMVTAGQAASNPAGLVANGNAPGDATYIYALKIESNTTLPQAPAALNQKYSHNELFIVVGNF